MSSVFRSDSTLTSASREDNQQGVRASGYDIHCQQDEYFVLNMLKLDQLIVPMLAWSRQVMSSSTNW